MIKQLHSKSYHKNLRDYLRKTALLMVIGNEWKWEWGSKDIIILTLDKTGATTVPNLSALCLSLSTSVAYKKIYMLLILASTEVF